MTNRNDMFELKETLDVESRFLDIAMQGAQCGEPKRTMIHMREVAPQMEQDAKDAARYRHMKNMGLVSFKGGLSCEWDEIIDKAIENDLHNT